MDHHSDLLARIWASLSYLVSGGLVFGDIMEWLNDNAGAVGAMCAIATMGINWYYQRKNKRETS